MTFFKEKQKLLNVIHEDGFGEFFLDILTGGWIKFIALPLFAVVVTFFLNWQNSHFLQYLCLALFCLLAWSKLKFLDLRLASLGVLSVIASIVMSGVYAAETGLKEGISYGMPFMAALLCFFLPTFLIHYVFTEKKATEGILKQKAGVVVTERSKETAKIRHLLRLTPQK